MHVLKIMYACERLYTFSNDVFYVDYGFRSGAGTIDFSGQYAWNFGVLVVMFSTGKVCGLCVCLCESVTGEVCFGYEESWYCSVEHICTWTGCKAYSHLLSMLAMYRSVFVWCQSCTLQLTFSFLGKMGGI